MKKAIKLTESDLHRIVKESVNKIIKEEEEELVYNPHFGPADSITGGKFKLPNGKLTEIENLGEEIAELVKSMRTLYGNINILLNSDSKFRASKAGDLVWDVKQALNDLYEKLWYLNEGVLQYYV
jgi:hypothetical protein